MSKVNKPNWKNEYPQEVKELLKVSYELAVLSDKSTSLKKRIVKLYSPYQVEDKVTYKIGSKGKTRYGKIVRVGFVHFDGELSKSNAVDGKWIITIKPTHDDYTDKHDVLGYDFIGNTAEIRTILTVNGKEATDE